MMKIHFVLHSVRFESEPMPIANKSYQGINARLEDSLLEQLSSRQS